jgi:hypothetical protein
MHYCMLGITPAWSARKYDVREYAFLRTRYDTSVLTHLATSLQYDTRWSILLRVLVLQEQTLGNQPYAAIILRRSPAFLIRIVTGLFAYHRYLS